MSDVVDIVDGTILVTAQLGVDQLITVKVGCVWSSPEDLYVVTLLGYRLDMTAEWRDDVIAGLLVIGRTTFTLDVIDELLIVGVSCC